MAEPGTAVRAYDTWASNAELIADVARLGWLKPEDRIYDPTYGHGVFWKVWQPDPTEGGKLFASDLNLVKSPMKRSINFTALPFRDRMFDAVVFDPPYKLNGTPDEVVDERYGVDEPTDWKDRMDLILAGAKECARVASDRLLVKCMDQVVSGEIVWQTTLITRTVGEVRDDENRTRFRLADRFDLAGSGRAQPSGRKQKHAYHRPSTLLVFKRYRDSSIRPYRV